MTDTVRLKTIIVFEEKYAGMSQHDSSGAEEGVSALDEAVPSEAELEDLRSILDRTRCTILQQILAHDSGVLSRPELAARNPDVNESTLQYHIDTLVERGILTKLDAPASRRDLPNVFYAVSQRGIELLKRVNLYDEIAVWNQVYSHVPTPETLEKVEEMERPEPDWYENSN